MEIETETIAFKTSSKAKIKNAVDLRTSSVGRTSFRLFIVV